MTPTPTAARFTLMRCGLISLFHYANQVFDAEDGHLLLRGSNGSGKSTAVELIAPLLFDGGLTSSNLSTSDGQRSIAYHLLLDGLYTRRLGYSWAQFARVDADGTERWVTLALGVKMSQDTRHDPWFLIWDTPVMIDPHVMLVRDGEAPLGRKDAAKLPDVEVFDSAEDYRTRVNALLFGFTERRYLAMIRLMRRLRSAQLGKSINVAQTTELLELALPELDVDLLAGVGGKLDELESLRSELASLREANGAAARFVERYRGFAGNVVARELSAADDVVRAARRESRRERQLDGKREQAEADVAQAERDLARVEEQIAHAQGELNALQASERWQAVEEIGGAQARAEAQQERARRAERRATEVHDEAAELAEELEQSGAELAGADRDLAAVGGVLRDACARAGLTDVLELPVRGPGVELLDGARRTRRSALRRLGELQAAAAAAREHATRQRSALDGLEAAERELRAQRGELELDRDMAQGSLVDAVDAWADTLVELRLDATEREALLRGAASADIALTIDAPVLRATRLLAAEEEQWFARRREIETRRVALEAEQADLHADKDAPPPLAPWRDADQGGTPLWRLCDFDPSLDAAARAGLERALEGCGLLDARVDQIGTLRAGNVVLGPGAGRADGRTLADVLSGPKALEAIAVLDADARGPFAVGFDGTFAIGPLRGRGADGAARFIGADARQAARERRIAEIDERLAELDGEDERVTGELAELGRRSEALDADRAALPAVAELADAWERWRAAGRELEARRAALEAQRERAREASERLAAADDAVGTHAAEHGLPRAPDVLAGLEEGLERLTEALPEARTKLALRERCRSTRRERYERHEKAVTRDERARAEAADERRQAEELSGFAERLAATVGTDRDEVLKEAEALNAELAQFTRHRETLHQQAKRQTGTMERLRAERDAASSELERLLRQQDARAAKLGELDGAGLVALALDTDAEPSAWDAERIATLWKERRSELEAAEEVSANDIYREFDQLRAALDASLGIEAVLDLLGDVPLVSAAYGGAHVPIAAAARSLGAELERQELTLADQEQLLFEEFLFGDVANELRARIADADEIARAASQKISAVRTSSGVGVDLQWELRPDLDASVRAVIGLLRRSDPRALPVEHRTTLMGFFRDRLAEARAGEEHATLVEHLQVTLDYRRWFKFRIFQIKDGARTELTRRTHSRDSGGEKSVTLHLPLLAAYHALLTGAQPHAPRLVALDEAFAGIDRSGQQQLLEVLDDKFDMDFMLTSEKLWCFEPQVHRLGVYQLRRFEGAPVAAVHWRWWGDERRKEMVVADGQVVAEA